MNGNDDIKKWNDIENDFGVTDGYYAGADGRVRD